MGSQPSKLTSEQCDALVSQVSYCHIHETASRSNILKALSKVQPSVTTASWLYSVVIRSTSDSTVWYQSGSTGHTSLHFVASYPAYLEQYALVGGDLTLHQKMPAIKGSPTVADLDRTVTGPGTSQDFWWPSIPEVDEKDPNSQARIASAIARREMAFCLGKNHIIGARAAKEDLVAMAIKYHCYHQAIIDWELGDLVKARSQLVSDVSNPVAFEVLLKGYTGLVAKTLRDAALAPYDSAQILEITRGTTLGTHGRLMSKYGTIGRVSLQNTGILHHVLGIPQTAQYKVPELLLLVELMLTDIPGHQQKIRESNIRRLEEYQNQLPDVVPIVDNDEIAFPAKMWDPKVHEQKTVTNGQLLNYLPGDLVPCSRDGKVRYYVRGLDQDKVESASISGRLTLLQIEAENFRLPFPAPLVETLEEVSTIKFNTKSLATTVKPKSSGGCDHSLAKLLASLTVAK